jgi:4-oxalocrotonate tautomerase
MPIVQITLVEGRDPAAIKQCIQEVARTVHRTLGAPMDTIRILVTQLPPTQWGVGDRTREDIDVERAAKKASGS